MSIFKKIDQVLATFGNVRAMKRTHVDTFTEERISNIQSEEFAKSEYGIIYFDFQELAGYFFLNTIVLSNTNFKTNKGSSLEFESLGENFSFKSDDYIIDSDYSNVSNRYITKISYPISEEELCVIQKKEFDSFVFKVKKYSIEFKVS